jgi:AcrR family transcriptional regulator
MAATEGAAVRKGTRRGTLSRAAIVRAAVALADREGLPRLSMRALAKELGVEAMSLYHHVPNKDDVLDGMVDHVFAEIHLPVVGGPDWRRELRRRCVSGREAMLRHPWAVGLMDSRPNAGTETLRHHDAVVGCLRQAGFGWPMVSHAMVLLDAHLYGFMVQELSLPALDGEDLGELATRMLDAPGAALPHLAAFTSEHVLRPGYRFGDEFEIGLDFLLDAIEDRLRADDRASR